MMDNGYWILDIFEKGVDRVESVAVDVVARLAPWLAPAPTAYMVYARTVEHLRWPGWVGVMAALVIEGLGLAVTATLLDLYRYNTTRRASDPRAPVILPVVLVGVYFVAAELLTVALDVVPKVALGISLVDWAPAVFPVLSLAGVSVLALRADHRRRLEEIETVKRERKERRKANRQRRRQGNMAGATELSSEALNTEVFDANLDRARQTRKAKRDARLDSLLTFYTDNPDAGPTEAGRHIGVTRQTVYGYLNELEAAGRVRRNNGVVTVL